MVSLGTSHSYKNNIIFATCRNKSRNSPLECLIADSRSSHLANNETDTTIKKSLFGFPFEYQFLCTAIDLRVIRALPDILSPVSTLFCTHYPTNSITFHSFAISFNQYCCELRMKFSKKLIENNNSKHTRIN